MPSRTEPTLYVWTSCLDSFTVFEPFETHCEVWHSKCWVEGGRMEHLSYQSIDEYVSGTLRSEERAAFDAHSCDCEECQRRITVAALSLRMEARIWRLLTEPEDGDELVGGPVAGRVVCLQS